MKPTQYPLPRSSLRLSRLFAVYLRRYFRRHFDAIRVSRSGSIPAAQLGPLIVYANHPSWWDPILFSLLSVELFPGRRSYGPMEAEALEQYPIFKRIGVFGIEPGTHRGAVKFLQTVEKIFEQDDSLLWLTAEGEFTDPRKRPVRLQFGLAHLMRRFPEIPVLPLAVEYPFWNERLPEVLLRFGPPVEDLEKISLREREQTWAINRRLERHLEQTMDALAEEARTRDPERFERLLLGRAGVGGVYDLWRRWRATGDSDSLVLSHEEKR